MIEEIDFIGNLRCKKVEIKSWKGAFSLISISAYIYIVFNIFLKVTTMFFFY